jgi:threonine synthase
MECISTRSVELPHSVKTHWLKTQSTQTKPVTFQHALFQGLAPDGGLYLPANSYDLTQVFQGLTKEHSFIHIATKVLQALLGDELSHSQIQSLAEKAFPFSPSLVELGRNHHLLELYNGPSCAFKDYGASFLATAMETYLNQQHRRAVILTATSGDTGSAVAQAFYGKDSIDVVILYPSGRVSPSQELQLTTLGGNIHALEVKGSFDDCQRIVKEAFQNPELNQTYSLTSANSINLGRLIPQSLYYIWAWAQVRDQLKQHGGAMPSESNYSNADPKDSSGSRLAQGAATSRPFGGNAGQVHFCVPSGNFGNLTGGILASLWGLPVGGFLAATNANSVVPEFLTSGVYQPRASIPTYANAMDVGNPSNFERLEFLFRQIPRGLSSILKGSWVDDATILQTMARYEQDQGLFLCPHSAVGVKAGQDYQNQFMSQDDVLITLGTAHPGKFTEVVVQATGKQPPIPERLAAFMNRKKQSVVVEPQVGAVEGFLKGLG